MAEVQVTPRVSPDNDVQKPGERTQADFDAIFNDIAFNSIIDGMQEDATESEGKHRAEKENPVTVADLKDKLAREAAERAQLEKTKELAKFLDNPADRRRGLIAIYGEDTVKDMTDADVEAFIGEKTGEPTTIAPEITTGNEVEEVSVPKAPEGFPTREEAEAEMQEQGSVRLGILGRARLALGAPGRAIWKGYSKFFDMAAKRSDRYNGMTSEEQDKLKKRVGLLSTLGALTIGAIAYGMKADSLVHTLGGGGGSGAANPTEDVPTNRVRGAEEYPTFAHDRRVAEFAFNPNDPLDPMNNPARHEYNFGAALNLESADAARNDLLEGLKHNPTQLAAAMGTFGLIPNDQASIENIADLMRNDPEVMMTNYDRVHEAASNVPVTLTAEQTATYGTYSAIGGNGNTVLTYQTATDTQPFLVFHTAGGEVCFGGECRQPVYLSGPAETVAPVVSSGVGNGEPTTSTLVGTRPHQPGIGNGPAPQPNQPVQPNNPNNPNPNNPNPQEPNPQGPNPQEPNPNNPNPEQPHEEKDYTGGVGTAEGIDPAQNGFVENTEDPLITGNGTDSPNLVPGVLGGDQSVTPDDSAQPNVDPQLPNVQPGANSGWEPNTAGQADQSAADQGGQAMDGHMTQPGAVDNAVDDAIAGMGSDGRPLGTSGAGNGTGLGNGAGNSGTGLGSLGNSLGNGTGLGSFGSGGNSLGSLGNSLGNGTGLGQSK